MTLRMTLTAAVCVLATLVLAGGIGLSVASRVLDHSTDAMLRDLETVRIGNQLELLLYRHRNYDQLWLASRSPEQFTLREQTEKELWAALKQLGDDTAGTEGAPEILMLDHEIDAWFLSLEKAYRESGYSPATNYEAIEPNLSRVVNHLRRLVDASTLKASRSQAIATRFDDKMNVVGIGLDFMAVLLCVLMISLLRHRLYMPVRQLEQSMQAYRGGDRAARCGVKRPAEIATIARVFNELADQLGQQRRSQLEFLSSIAHDLRAPLTSMKLYCDLIQPRHPFPNEERIRKAFTVLGRQTDRLNRMVSDLLDATRIEAGELSFQLQTSNLVEIAQETLNLFAEEASIHVFRLEAPGQILAQVDPARLQQVLTNLLSNAIKYSPEGGEVVMRVLEERDRVSVTVTDHGLGIASTELSRIFEPFRRSVSLQDKIPGVGLGLSVARRIVEGHGGTLTARSEPGQGTTFTIELPVMRAAA